MKGLPWDTSATVADNAARSLPALAQDFFAAGREVVVDSVKPEQLHAFRLKTKRLRYILELFEPVYGRAMEPRLKALKQIQTVLGDLNDRHTVDALFADPKAVAGSRKLRNTLAEEAAALTNEFRRLWTSEFDAPGEESKWINFLEGHSVPEEERARPVKRARKKSA